MFFVIMLNIKWYVYLDDMNGRFEMNLNVVVQKCVNDWCSIICYDEEMYEFS